MPAICQDLLRQLDLQELSALFQPARTFGSVKERSGKEKRLRVLEEVVGSKVLFEPPLERQRLHVQAGDDAVDGRTSGRRIFADLFQALSISGEELQPVDDSQRQRVGLPAGLAARRVAIAPVQRDSERRAQQALVFGIREVHIQEMAVIQVVVPKLG